MKMRDPTNVTRSQLIQGLKGLGLSAGQVVMLHASVKSIGRIVGGPDVVLQAIVDVLTPSGTLMMLAGWEDNPYELTRWPKERQEAYAAECPAYDPQRSRADRKELGILTEYLRTWPDACRSRHPFSYVAVGERAGWVTEEHPWQYRDGPGSPLAKLCEAGGSVLVLGSPLGNVTLLHHAEHLADVPGKRVDRYRMPILRGGRRVWMDFEEYDTTRGIADWPEDYFEVIVREYMAAGKGRSGKVGDADTYLFDAAGLRDSGARWMEEHLGGEAG